MQDAGAWLTGRRRTVRAAVHLLSAIAMATIAWGFLFGEARRACKCDEPEPPTRLLSHGGALALVALAVIAALTFVSWRARLGVALLTTGASLIAWIVLGLAWLLGDHRLGEALRQVAPDAAAYQAMLATSLLGALLLGRLLLDVALAWLQRRADARPTREPLPVGTVHRG